MNLNKKLFVWIGGKKWLSTKLKSKFETILKNNVNIKYYAEPFCGSLGSLLESIEVLQNNNIKAIYLNDINKTVINCFNFVKTDPIGVYENFKKIEFEHISLIPERAFVLHKTRDKAELKSLMQDSKNFYNQKRDRFNLIKNEDTIEATAIFLFLMERAFNGIYRENSSGNFNSPYNWDNKKINFDLKKETILEWSNFFNELNVQFSNMSYNEFIESLDNKKETLFYFDPPYLNDNLQENNYNKDSFDLIEQTNLLNIVDTLDHVVYSNHDVSKIREFFNTDKWVVETVWRKNIMTVINENRSNDIPEILASSK
jgi:DNA adenine methylase